ncbi:hypothetical protein CgunFtcFv8_004805 [Champsocephalus gunnari]|uniref:Uncharacterized protein n=1 Tax=Champsocephalus gunnari TaxID=52237 RepID=A0AAN8E1U9_CHAGU|nr:hypothetical protein CgunFtcFv8_004805 [Champsocephalus gunnari]
MPNTTSWEEGGASVTHPEDISTCVAVLWSLTLKMSEDQLCLNISVSSTPSLRRKPLTTQQRWAKKKQNAGKRKMNSSSQPEERRVKQRRVEEEEEEEEEQQVKHLT